ncbi:hypothetical protein TWF730_001126 [Orbilia blumenaviensis]|uniref:PPPDE domain-containing protein n=1 Tax=Orbilia blumenaviensis TaxID=1796055 RepID=A0AAV9VNN1_9PEZI
MASSQDARRNSEAGAMLIGPRRNSDSPSTAVTINVYDLLPPGKLSTVFWHMGVGLLHTGVAIGEREYAFGGHDRRGITGVYYLKPKQEPPGATFRTSIIHAHVSYTPDQIHDTLVEVSQEFLGTSYNVLTRNCNHFTSYLCEKLTGKPAPKWINRAASIGVALPCVVPQAWVRPPECEEEDQLNPEDFEDESEWEDDIDDDRFGLGDSDAEGEAGNGNGNDARPKASHGIPPSSSSGETVVTKETGRIEDMKAVRRSDENGRLLPKSERAILEQTVD